MYATVRNDAGHRYSLRRHEAHHGTGSDVLVPSSLLSAATAALALPAYAATTRQISGQGSTSQFRCPSGVVVPTTISFTARKDRGTVRGGYTIFGGGGFQAGKRNERHSQPEQLLAQRDYNV
jgi:hypothetical protein